MVFINFRKFFYFLILFLILFNENFFFVVFQIFRYMRGMLDKFGKLKVRRKNMVFKGFIKAEIKYKVGGNVISQ